MDKSYLAIYKTKDFYIGTYDLEKFVIFLYEGGIKILQLSVPSPSPVLPFLHGAYVVYVNKKELRKQKLTFDDIYELTY